MKILVSTIVCGLLITMSSLAQSPLADTIPQLKEWWRADNLGFGAPFGRDDNGGMTWLDNFYNGKGALVVSSPDGVKTWQMRFPGDTTNVFTWKGKGGLWRTLDGGNPTIKTGDFNGDGATDYIDAWGNIYEGIKNGEPPKTTVSSRGFNPSLVSDINGDGYDDMLAASAVVFGKKDLSNLKTETFTLRDIDSNNAPIASYMVGPNEMRIICRHYYWANNVNFPFRTIYKDGLRLVRAWWDGTGFKSEVLDEFSFTTTNGFSWFYGGKLFKQSLSEIYYLCQHEEGIITVYNLSKDKFDTIYSVTNPIGLIGSLKHSIDKDSIPDFFTESQTPDGIWHIKVYSGDIVKGIHPLCEFTTQQIAAFTSIRDVTGDGKPDLALSNYYIVSSREKYRFSILNLQDTLSSIEEGQSDANAIFISVISPMPATRDKVVRLKVSVPIVGNYTISMFNTRGEKINGKIEVYQLANEQILSLNIGAYEVFSGVYTLRLESSNGRTAHCSIIIQ